MRKTCHGCFPPRYTLLAEEAQSLVAQRPRPIADDPRVSVAGLLVSDATLRLPSHAKQVLFEHHLEASQSSSFDEFNQIQNRSDCVFAKHARCWSAPPWLNTISVEDNCQR